eukprot:6970355-Lingulodinium_polyedra.AAC.1
MVSWLARSTTGRTQVVSRSSTPRLETSPTSHATAVRRPARVGASSARPRVDDDVGSVGGID